MEKKTECEIVQDLLLSYADDVLNNESKKLVEKHLVECEKCREKLSEIKNDMKEQNETQKAQIDYLKKIRLKSRIKSFFFAVMILVVIFAGWYLYKFSIINKITRKVEEQFSGENFYIENIFSCDDDRVGFSKTWYKDGKYKIISYFEENGEITQVSYTRYGNIGENPKEEYWVFENIKEVRKEKLLFEQKKENFVAAQSTFLSKANKEEFGKHYIMMKLGEPFYVKISTDHKNIGRLYYVFDFGETKKWVDMDTGLPIMSFGDVIVQNYYENTKIPKQRFESIYEYHYEFGNVTDEEVEMPDFEGYELEERDWQEEIDRLLEEHEKNS